MLVLKLLYYDIIHNLQILSPEFTASSEINYS